MANDIDARLWRTLTAIWWLLALGVLGLLVGLAPQPQRVDSAFGLLLVGLVAVLAIVTVWRLPRPARAALRRLPKYRPALTLTAALLGVATVLVLCWTIADLLVPGTLSPLSIALLGVIAAGAVLAVRRFVPRG